MRGKDWNVVDRIDPHRPGDPRYGQPPAAFLKASSLGQILALFGLTQALSMNSSPRPTTAVSPLLTVEAVPGVSPLDLRDWRIAGRAAFQRRCKKDVLAEVPAAHRTLALAPRIDIAGVAVADLRRHGTVPELPEAAAFDGVPFLAMLAERGHTNVVLQAAPPLVVGAWMREQELHHRKPYSNPACGFAGVIVYS
jgi:hypothetical protein